MKIGDNKIEVIVLAEDKITEKKYEINVHRRNEQEEIENHEEQEIQAEKLTAILEQEEEENKIIEENKNTESNLRTKIQNSKEMQTAIDSCLKDSRTCSGGTEFIFDKDLAYSVGHAKYTIEKKYNYITNTRYLKITVFDIYNFDEYKKGFSFGNMANNMGLFYQNNELLFPYEWDITYFQFY